jgi:hypothetical protein
LTFLSSARVLNILEGFVKALRLPISLWMIRSCPGLVNIGQLAQLPDNFAFQMLSLITMEPTRKTRVINTIFKENVAFALLIFILVILAVVCAVWFLARIA